MPYIKLIHWNQEEAETLANEIKSGKFKIDCKLPDGPEFIKNLQANPPALFIISLARMLSQGRDLAILFRQKKTTRNIPIIFVDGIEEKVEKVRRLLPDAFFTNREKINSAIKSALKNESKNPVVPKSAFAGYAGTPLIKKLGIKENSKLALINSPDNFSGTLGTLPPHVSVSHNLRGKADTIIWFISRRSELEKRIESVSNALAPKGKVWIAWRKKSSGVKSDVSQNVVRQIGLASGIVDYKICSIDDNWSALLFTKRKN